MNARTVGLLHGGALGDFVLTWHLLGAVERVLGAARLRVWARGALVETGPRVWGLESLTDIEACGLHALFIEGVAAPDGLTGRLHGCELLVNCLSDRDSVLTRNLERITSGRILCIDPRPASSSGEHITAQWRAQLCEQYIDVPDIEPRKLNLCDDKSAEARRRLEAAAGKDRVALIHPGSGSRGKCWPPEHFVELAAALHKDEIGVVFVLGPVEQEIFGAAERRTLSCWPTIDSPGLTELMHLCAAADVCVGNDSGFSHLAAATGTRTVTLFGGTDPDVWRPLGPRVEVLGAADAWPDVPHTLTRIRQTDPS
jgi:hypothetical protein